MIQAILLIALGFLSASLIGVLIAPALWSRAYRLSRKRLEQTLPITLSEIESTQDQLRASYAVRLRRLETALATAKQKAAMQLVDNSRLQMQIVALKDEIADLDLKLSERRNAATVLEQTITKRFPELDREIVSVKAQLEERTYEIHDLTNKLGRRNEELEAAGRAASSYQDELARLQQVLEKNSADRSGRRFRRASQWSLDDFRAEYDRLNLEMSKLRQQLAQLQDRDAQQAGIIKEELQKLAELILVSAQPKTGAPMAGRPEPAVKRAAGAEVRRDRPVPWPEGIPAPKAEAPSDEESSLPTSGQPAGRQAAPANTVLPAILNALPDAGLKPHGANGSVEAAERAHIEPPAPRSRLLREAVPAKPAQESKNEDLARSAAQDRPAASRSGELGANALAAEDGAPDAGTAEGGAASPAAAPAMANGAAPAREELEPLMAPDPGGGAPLPAAAGRGVLTLLERLRGAAEEKVETDK